MTLFSSLNQRALLQANTLQDDGGGGYTDNWQAFAAVWVKLTPLAPAERFGPDRLEAKARHRILLRRRNDLAVGQRVVVGPRVFAVHGIADEGPRAAFITLWCEELP
ncbi:MAG: phage head closure protein [Rhizomicrobium sp.]|nr:phage head closure protein [Rhizomicrobium sp.]